MAPSDACASCERREVRAAMRTARTCALGGCGQNGQVARRVAAAPWPRVQGWGGGVSWWGVVVWCGV
eukprot:4334783-Prymnesium_polylepis.2